MPPLSDWLERSVGRRERRIEAIACRALGVSSGLALADPPSSRLPPKGNLSERCAAPKACRLVGEPALCGLLLGVGGAPLTGDALVGDALVRQRAGGDGRRPVGAW